MHAGARLRKEPAARPNTMLNMYRPAKVFPNGSQMTNTAKAPRTMRAAWVLIRPYLSAIPPATSRPSVEHLEEHEHVNK